MMVLLLSTTSDYGAGSHANVPLLRYAELVAGMKLAVAENLCVCSSTVRQLASQPTQPLLQDGIMAGSWPANSCTTQPAISSAPNTTQQWCAHGSAIVCAAVAAGNACAMQMLPPQKQLLLCNHALHPASSVPTTMCRPARPQRRPPS
jgi:hypothetical protein